MILIDRRREITKGSKGTVVNWNCHSIKGEANKTTSPVSLIFLYLEPD